jgi:hypothetical protein
MRSVASIAVVMSPASPAVGLSAYGEPPHHGPPPVTTPEVDTIVLPGRTVPVFVAEVRPQVSSVRALNCVGTSQQPKGCGATILVSLRAAVISEQLTCSFSSPASSHPWRAGPIHFAEGR